MPQTSLVPLLGGKPTLWKRVQIGLNYRGWSVCAGLAQKHCCNLIISHLPHAAVLSPMDWSIIFIQLIFYHKPVAAFQSVPNCELVRSSVKSRQRTDLSFTRMYCLLFGAWLADGQCQAYTWGMWCFFFFQYRGISILLYMMSAWCIKVWSCLH